MKLRLRLTTSPPWLDTMAQTKDTQPNASSGTINGGMDKLHMHQSTLFAVFQFAHHANTSYLIPPSASNGTTNGGKDMLAQLQSPPSAVSVPAPHATASPGTTDCGMDMPVLIQSPPSAVSPMCPMLKMSMIYS